MLNYGQPGFGVVKETYPVVETSYGKVKGKGRNGIAAFHAIPYGADTGGENRFLPPKPAKKWEGILDCTKNRTYAPQLGRVGGGDYFCAGHPERFGYEELVQSEDCLVLNINTPGLDEKKRPVLVYLHGGGFQTGSGTVVLGADRLTDEEDIVVVGVNHRLNVFGFLYLGAFDSNYKDSGMVGMLDLVLALKWVQKNIAAFGGDPDKVTIMGESGGGMKVSTLLAMPEARGLFRSAIVESGSNVVGRYSTEQAAKVAERCLEKLGVSKEDLSSLTDIPVERLLEVLRIEGVSFSPVADGIHLEYQEADKFVAPEISKDIPLLIGSSEDELGMFLGTQVQGMTEESLKEELMKAGTMPGTEAIPADRVEEVIRVFREYHEKYDGKILDPAHLFLNIRSLSSFLGIGARHQAEAKAVQGGAPVYHYLVAYDTPFPNRGRAALNVSPIKPAAHEEEKECAYAWHVADLALQFRIVQHPEAEELSKKFGHAWAAFVRTGSPSTEELPWEAFDMETRQVMVFDERTRMETDPLEMILALNL